MSENHEKHDEHGDDHGDGHHINYVGIYVALLVLFAISVAGPELGRVTGLRWITLFTAFGIAVVKARLVINNFMHLKWEKRLMKFVLGASVLLMFIMVAGVAPDVLNHEGNNWVNVSAQAAVERGLGGEVADTQPEIVVAPTTFAAATSYGQICATCHGAAGDGTGAAGVALDPKPADFTDPVFWETRDRARIVQVIRDGAASVGGSMLMAPWGALYNAEQLDEMTDYVMTFRPEE